MLNCKTFRRKLKNQRKMKKCLFILTIITAFSLLIPSCDNFKRDIKSNADINNDMTAEPEIAIDNYLNGIDEYVNYIKANGEKLQFIHSLGQNNKIVISVLDNDTVRISFLGDSIKEDIDIYFKDSQPLLLSRERVLDVDSNFLETVYLKDNKIYKCFRDGIELKNQDSLKRYSAMLSVTLGRRKKFSGG